MTVIRIIVIFFLSVNLYALRADVNNDCHVDLLDFTILASEWMQEDEDCMSLLGDELVTNGTFATNASWTWGGDWIWNGGTALEAIMVNASSGTLSQSISITSGRTYTVSFYRSSSLLEVGELKAYLGGTEYVIDAGVGTVTTNIVASSTDSLIRFVGDIDAGESIALDTVSVKELSVATKIEQALWDILRLDTTVRGLVTERIYPQIIPQNTSYPAMRYNQISGIREHTLTDTSNMVSARFQIDSMATTLLAGRTLADAVRTRLDNYHATVGSVVIQCTHLIDEQDYYSDEIGVDSLRKYGKTQDYMIWYNE